MVDVTGREVHVGSRVSVAFSYSRASVGRQKVGKVVSLQPFIVHWDDTDKDSPPMVFDSRRLVVLDCSLIHL